MTDTTTIDGNVTNHTIAWMRRIDDKIVQFTERSITLMDIIVRFDTRLGRVERDVHEIKGDQILLENRLLNLLNQQYELLREVESRTKGIEVIDRRVEALEGRLEATEKRGDGIETRLEGVEQRLGRVEERTIRVEDKLDLLISKLIKDN